MATFLWDGEMLSNIKNLETFETSQLNFPSEKESCNYKLKLKGDSLKIVDLEDLVYGGVIAKKGVGQGAV